ncbi:hypothetical protein H105_07060 [Trichophyton soudanense CBS 452.61]|uniref:Uncharacterized protein n=1 Tax=Trichophyton soudanense CBS 452.61 TaxID=1215331 RepID=A0A022XJX1_TRISD|nr:hypothetical protein H105_07060 [Trichophyton soudanense CBS 452.61]EZG03413.1 hypothetical protein H106_06890 [Trichophyton rubrum CBS 735.88]
MPAADPRFRPPFLRCWKSVLSCPVLSYVDAEASVGQPDTDRPLRWVARCNAHLQSARRKQETQAPWPGDSAEAVAVLCKIRPAEVQRRREEKKGKREDGEEDKAERGRSRDEEEEEEEEEEKSRGEMKGLQGEPARCRLVPFLRSWDVDNNILITKEATSTGRLHVIPSSFAAGRLFCKRP